MRLVWIGVKNPLCTDRCRHGSVYHNNGLWQLEINRRLIFWRGNPLQWNRLRSNKLQVKLPCLLLLKDFVSGIGIMLLEFRLLRSLDIFWNHATWSQKAWKRGNLEICIVYIYICAWLSRSGSFGIVSVLKQFRATSTCCILSFSFIGGTIVLEFLQPFFLVTVPKMGKNFSSWHIENLTRTKANLRWNNQIENLR